jgi:secreted trypsin-like serine protease
LYTDTGYRDLEIGIAPGDSGGPGFIDGKIAGVHSFGFTYFCGGFTNAPDATCGLDSSFGEMSGDARVSSYAGWIDDQVANGVDTPIPEPLPAAAAAVEGSAADVTSALGLELLNHSVARHMRLMVTPVQSND